MAVYFVGLNWSIFFATFRGRCDGASAFWCFLPGRLVDIQSCNLTGLTTLAT